MTTSFSFSRFSALMLCIWGLFFSACNGDKSFSVQDLQGKWKCVDGSLNGKPQGPQGMITGFGFEFTDKNFVSNILPQLEMTDTVVTYELKDNKIMLAGNPDKFFAVESFNEGLLILGLKSSDMEFKFHLKKQ